MNLPYNLHDSTIVSLSIEKHEVSVIIDLYPVLYPEKPRIVLSFYSVYNFEKLKTYFEDILNEADDGYIGCRIDALMYDNKKESKEGNLWFFLKTDWNGPLRVHCTEMKISRL